MADLVSTHGQRPAVFPLELYRPVVELIHDIPSLLSLLTTSVALNVEAERSLYHTVALERRHFPTRSLHFLQRITSCERVARLVVRLHISQLSGDAGDTADLQEELSAALPALVNLKALSCNQYPIDIPPSLSACTFQLREFKWVYVMMSSILGFPVFLEKQPLLKTMYLDYVGRALSLAPSVCPQLSILKGRTAEIRAFLRSRRVSHVLWIRPFHYKYMETVTELAEPLTHIRSLVLQDLLRDSLVPPLVSHMHQLQYLRVEAFQILHVEHYFPLVHLRGVTLVARNYGHEGDVAVAAQLFSQIAGLRFAELGGTEADSTFLRWERDGTMPTPIDVPHHWLSAIP